MSFYSVQKGKGSLTCARPGARIEVCWEDDDQFHLRVLQHFTNEGKAFVKINTHKNIHSLAEHLMSRLVA